MKGNMFLGYARGAVGDVVFSRVNGQQTGRARNRRPNNPRSQGQMRQRSLFSNVVKFHTKGVQRLFKFAFEDKAANESDYNAFMKHNLNSSVRISKQASQSILYPALGNWQMACGSLEPVALSLTSTTNVWRLSTPGSSSNITTWGAFWTAIKQSMNLMEGDIMTIVHITAVGATASNMPSVEVPSGLQGADWNMDQFEVDSTSTVALPSWISPDNDYTALSFANVSTDLYAQGVAVIFSRKTAQGLKVSTSFLIGNAVTNSIIEACQSESYIERVLASWQTSEDAILEGALLP